LRWICFEGKVEYDQVVLGDGIGSMARTLKNKLKRLRKYYLFLDLEGEKGTMNDSKI